MQFNALCYAGKKARLLCRKEAQVAVKQEQYIFPTRLGLFTWREAN